MNLDQLIEEVNSKETFLDFVRALAADRAEEIQRRVLCRAEAVAAFVHVSQVWSARGSLSGR
jgi:hypothetical protein